MIPALLALFLNAQASPGLSCVEEQIDLPKPKLPFKAPKGLAWEGIEPVATLSDGRLIFTRAAALDAMSHKARGAMLEQRTQMRIMQLIAHDPSQGEPQVWLLPRALILELHALPGGGIAAALNVNGVNALYVLDGSDSTPEPITLPNPVAHEKVWRDRSPYKGNGPPRLSPTGEHTIVYTYGGNSYAIDLKARQVVRSAAVWSAEIAAMHPPSKPARVLALELGSNLVRFSDTLTLLQRRPCPSCRLISLGRHSDSRPTVAALAAPDNEGISVIYLRPDTSLDDLATRHIIELPADLFDGPWAWTLRSGPGNLALISLSAMTSSPAHHVFALDPDRDEPVWTWHGTDEGGPSQRLVADALGDQVRFRIVQGEGHAEETLRAALFQPSQGEPTAWISDEDLEAPLKRRLFAPMAPHQQGPHSSADVEGDPMFDRTPHKAHQATFQRCTLTVDPS
ncbi:MAG: hypothetical protein EA397_01170 [Deltaproteobacteria bacterium]|nr:MAG: hypothetical protein EA397_01170 [Deltaproteobacteria bacterium]